MLYQVSYPYPFPAGVIQQFSNYIQLMVPWPNLLLFLFPRVLIFLFDYLGVILNNIGKAFTA